MGTGLRERDRGRLAVLRTFLKPEACLEHLNETLSQSQAPYTLEQVKGALRRPDELLPLGAPGKVTDWDRELVRALVLENNEISMEDLFLCFQQQHSDVGLGVRDLCKRTLWKVAHALSEHN